MRTVDATRAERDLLRRLGEVGGRYTFRPDGESLLAFRIFEEGIAAVLLSLEIKRLVRFDSSASELMRVPGHGLRFASLTAELTEAGREALH